MSLPPWKQALLDRRKKQEDEQKKKRAEEDAQLASLPPWKRALLLKQREKKEKEAGVAPKEVAVERSDSFSKWKSQTQKKNEETRPPWVKKTVADAPRTGGSISTSGRSYSVGSKPASSTTTTNSSSTIATSSPLAQKRVRRESVTVVPDPEDTPVLLAFRRTNSPEPGSPSLVRSLGPVSLRKKNQAPVNIKEKRMSFEDHDDKFASMPAWKKALILRRRAEASKQEKQEKQDKQDALEEKEPQPVAESQHAKQVDRTSIPLEQKPDMVAVQKGSKPRESREPEEHDTSTVSQEHPRSYSPTTRSKDSPSTTAPKRSAPPRPSSRPTPTRTAPRPPPTSPAPKAPPKSIAPKMPQTATAPKTISASTAPKTSSTASQKTTHTTKLATSSRSHPAPEIVNRKQAENVTSNKLVQQEGVTLHAPVFKEVDQWANVSQDDPKFKNLPSWKQALILRRRADIAKRTGSTSSSSAPSPIPSLTEEAHVKTAWSPRNSFDEAKFSNVPLWKQEFLKKKQSAGSSGLETSSSMKQESSSKPKNTTSSTRSPIKGGNVKALLGRFNQGGSEPSTLTTNKPNLSRPSAPSRHTLQLTSRTSSEDVSSDSSDEELEEIPLTSIDEVSTEEEDDDDSGISAGGSVPKTGSPKRSRHTNRTMVFNNELKKPSILIDPINRPMKGLRRVSFSDSQLVSEHVYPKYDYADYEEIDHDKEDEGWSETDGGDTNENLGLSHKLHPSLRSPSPTKTDSYRYSSPSPTNKHSSSDSDLQHYTPSILSSYGDDLQRHFSGNPSSPLHNGVRDDASPTAKSSDDVMPATEEQTSDFYATLNSDAAAMLW